MSDWSETATAAAGVATATKAGDPRKKETIRGVSASYNVAADAGTLEVKFGSTIVHQCEVHPGQTVHIPFKREADLNEAISAELAASTGTGQVNIWGDDRGATKITG